MTTSPRSELSGKFAQYRQRLSGADRPVVEGQLKRVVGTMLEAVGCKAPVGGYCLVEAADGEWLETEVVGFATDKILLMPTGELRGVMPNARVIPIEKGSDFPVGDGLLGR